MALTSVVEIRKQFVPGQISARLDDARQPRIIDIGFIAATALAAETQMNMAPLYSGVPVAQGRQAKAPGPGIFAITDAKKRQFKKPDDRGQHPFQGQTMTTKIDGNPGSYRRQHPGKQQHLIIFCFVADLPPSEMVAMLLATPFVPSGYLKVSERVWTDPHSRPGGRDHQ
jgi:hypothetical protein